MKKNLVAVLAAVVMTASMVACGGNAEETTATSTAVESTVEATETVAE